MMLTFRSCWLGIVFHTLCICAGKSFNVSFAIFDLARDFITLYMFYDAVTLDEYSCILFLQFCVFLNIMTLVIIYVRTISFAAFIIFMSARWRHGKIYRIITRILFNTVFDIFFDRVSRVINI